MRSSTLFHAAFSTLTTVEFGVIRLITLVLAVWFGLDWTAVSYNVAVLLYSPRSLMLVLPIVGGTPASYLGLIALPIAVTLVCIALFREITLISPSANESSYSYAECWLLPALRPVHWLSATVSRKK
jgi:hypothetical protein